jgi:tetratricopeptide (TPR) repeat protein
MVKKSVLFAAIILVSFCARVLADEATPVAGDSPGLKYNMNGMIEFNKGDFKGAIKLFNKAIKADPKNTINYCNKAMSLNKLGKYKDAISECDKAIKIDEKCDTAYAYKALSQMAFYKFDDAVASCDKAIEINPDSMMAWANKSVALTLQGKADDALSASKKAISLDPDNAVNWSNMGMAQAMTKEVEDSEASGDEALRLDPGMASGMIIKAGALINMGKYQKALEWTDKAIATNTKPDINLAWGQKAVCLLKMERYEEALDVYEKAAKLMPKIADMRTGAGICYYYVNNWVDALVTLNKALDINVKDGKAWYYKALTLEKLERPGEAKDCMKYACQMGYDEACPPMEKAYE